MKHAMCRMVLGFMKLNPVDKKKTAEGKRPRGGQMQEKVTGILRVAWE
jgi:hypothetical protein